MSHDQIAVSTERVTQPSNGEPIVSPRIPRASGPCSPSWAYIGERWESQNYWKCHFSFGFFLAWRLPRCYSSHTAFGGGEIVGFRCAIGRWGTF